MGGVGNNEPVKGYYSIDGAYKECQTNTDNSLYSCYWSGGNDNKKTMSYSYKWVNNIDIKTLNKRERESSEAVKTYFNGDFLQVGRHYPQSKPMYSDAEWRVVVNGTVLIEHALTEWNPAQQAYIPTGKTEWRSHLVKPRIFPTIGHPDTSDGTKTYSDSAVYHATRCEHWVQTNGIDAGINYCEFSGIEPPVINEEAELATDLNSPESAIKRMCSASWWERKLAIKHKRKAELNRIVKGIVHKDKQPYCSDTCLNDWLLRQSLGKEYMEGLEAISEHGEVVKMADLLKGSQSNPRIRRIELNKRTYGFVDHAQDLGHVFGFFTMTASGKYHPNSKNYNDWSPRQTNADNLMAKWEKIRAELDRQDIRMYGFRFVEPHADGCPHWHMALFFENEDMRKKATQIMKEYALAEDIGELKVKGYQLVPVIDAVKNSFFALHRLFSDLLNNRKRIFQRDLTKFSAMASDLINDMESLKSAIPAKYRFFLSELSKMQGELKLIVSEALDVGTAISELVTNIRVEYVRGSKALRDAIAKLKKRAYLFKSMTYQFDKWGTVKSKGKGKVKEKWKVRFDYEYVKDAGAIVAYVTKYVGKNIDGKEAGNKKMDGDQETNLDSADSAQRVRAWASLWGIRQFQQIGGSSVSAWRILRTKDSFDNELLEEFRYEADKGDWAQYLSLQGGALMPMRQQLLRPYYSTLNDAWTGKIKTSPYGEHVQKLLGVKLQGAGQFDCVEVTKDTQWKLEKIPSAMVKIDVVTSTKAVDAVVTQGASLAQIIHDESREENTNIFVKREVVDSPCEHSEPWLSVNNYTSDEIRNAENECFLSGGAVFDDGGRDLDDIDLYDLII